MVNSIAGKYEVFIPKVLSNKYLKRILPQLCKITRDIKLIMFQTKFIERFYPLPSLETYKKVAKKVCSYFMISK